MIYCGACGINFVQRKEENCGCMRHRNWLDNAKCGVCGAQATMFFVHGFRCKEHEFQKEPSNALIGDKVIAVIVPY